MLLLRTIRNPDLAIDLGTAVARVGINRVDSFVQCPNRIGNISAMRNGVVVNPEAAGEILHGLFRRFQRLGIFAQRTLACAPSDASEAERDALRIAVKLAGASEVYIAPDPLAAAIGSGIDVADKCSSMIIDMGEGVTDCAVISQGQIIASTAVRGGCFALRERVIQTVVEEMGILLSEDEAERIVRHVGLPEGAGRGAKGIVVASGTAAGTIIARRHPLPACVVAGAIAAFADGPLDAVATFVSELPSRCVSEVMESGVVLTGGGALIPGIAERLEERLKLPVRVAATPLESVIRGAQEMIGVAAAARLWS